MSFSSLYSHVVEHAFSFCTLSELSRLMSVSQCFADSVMSMLPLRFALSDRQGSYAIKISTLLQSRVLRHVSDLNRRVNLDSLTLRLLLQRTPALDVLTCTLPLPQSGSLVFPGLLRTLHIEATGAVSYSVLNALILAVSKIAALEDLRLEFQRYLPLIRFTPLQALERLRAFELKFSINNAGVVLNDAQVADLRFLAASRSAERDTRVVCAKLVLPVPEVNLLQLLDDNSPCAVEQAWRKGHTFAPEPVYLDPAVCALLQRLPCLTALHHAVNPGTFVSAMPLASLHRLQILVLHLHMGCEPSSVASALHGLTDLRELEIRECAVTSEHLASFLPALVHLQSLHLNQLPQLQSLSAFALPTLATSLTSLSVINCGPFSPRELDHLLGLVELTTLRTYSSLHHPGMDEQREQSLRAALPKLVTIS